MLLYLSKKVLCSALQKFFFPFISKEIEWSVSKPFQVKSEEFWYSSRSGVKRTRECMPFVLAALIPFFFDIPQRKPHIIRNKQDEY